MGELLMDLRHNCGPAYRDPETRLKAAAVVRTVLTARFAAVFLFRLSQSTGRAFGPVGSVFKQLNQMVTGADIAWQARVGGGLVLFHPVGVVIGEHVELGRMAVLQQGVTIGGTGSWNESRATSPRIGDSVVFGAGCRVVGGIDVGSNVVIGANAVVTKDVPADSVALGVPAQSRPRTSVEGQTVSSP